MAKRKQKKEGQKQKQKQTVKQSVIIKLNEPIKAKRQQARRKQPVKQPPPPEPSKPVSSPIQFIPYIANQPVPQQSIVQPQPVSQPVSQSVSQQVHQPLEQLKAVSLTEMIKSEQPKIFQPLSLPSLSEDSILTSSSHGIEPLPQLEDEAQQSDIKMVEEMKPAHHPSTEALVKGDKSLSVEEQEAQQQDEDFVRSSTSSISSRSMSESSILEQLSQIPPATEPTKIERFFGKPEIPRVNIEQYKRKPIPPPPKGSPFSIDDRISQLNVRTHPTQASAERGRGRPSQIEFIGSPENIQTLKAIDREKLTAEQIKKIAEDNGVVYPKSTVQKQRLLKGIDKVLGTTF